jgi:hypothetical protein
VSATQRAALEKLRRDIKAAAPAAGECISYDIPDYRLGSRLLVSFGAAKNPLRLLSRCSHLWDRGGRIFFVADAHCDDGKRFVVRADEKVTAFLELEKVTRGSLRFQNAE